MSEALTTPQESKKRKLIIRKLIPPPEAQPRIMAKDKARANPHSFIGALKLFFLEDGF